MSEFQRPWANGEDGGQDYSDAAWQEYLSRRAQHTLPPSPPFEYPETPEELRNLLSVKVGELKIAFEGLLAGHQAGYAVEAGTLGEEGFSNGQGFSLEPPTKDLLTSWREQTGIGREQVVAVDFARSEGERIRLVGAYRPNPHTMYNTTSFELQNYQLPGFLGLDLDDYMGDNRNDKDDNWRPSALTYMPTYADRTLRSWMRVEEIRFGFGPGSDPHIADMVGDKDKAQGIYVFGNRYIDNMAGVTLVPGTFDGSKIPPRFLYPQDQRLYETHGKAGMVARHFMHILNAAQEAHRGIVVQTVADKLGEPSQRDGGTA